MNIQHAANRTVAGAAWLTLCFLGLPGDIPAVSAQAIVGGKGPEQATSSPQVSAPLSPVAVTNFRCHITVPAGSGLPSNPPPCDITRVQGPGGAPNQFAPLLYHGGPVVTSTTQQFIFLNCLIDNNHCNSDVGNPWGSGGFLNDLFNSNFIHVADQYIGPRSNGRYTTNTSFYTWVSGSEPHTMHDSDVHTIIMFAINNVLNPNGGGGGYNQMYSLHLMQGQDLCFNNSTSCYCPDNNCNGGNFVFCAYHGSFDAVDRTNTTIHVIYQAIPFQDVNGCAITNGPNGALVDSTNNVLSHEIFETITDPDLNAWFDSSGNEIGDLCNFNEQNPIWLNANAYSIQKEYSNVVGGTPPAGCVGIGADTNITHDFNGHNRSDILWRDSSGNTAAWFMNGATIVLTGGLGNVPTTWSVIGQRDFNFDGNYDLLWRDTSGNLAMWFLNGLTVSAVGLGNVPTVWSVVGTGDFNADNKGDLLWKDNTGNVAIWLMNGSSVLASGLLGNVGTSWSVAGTADFNGDGKSDILWKDTSGNVAIWFMNGLSHSGTLPLGNVGPTWSVAGTADFDGDGLWDILWRDTSGNVAIWLNSGPRGGLGLVPTNWIVAETGDYNGDGKSDILWRDTSTGSTAIWFMNGLTISSSPVIGVVATSWTIQGVNAD